MIRGTTPTIRLVLPFDANMLAEGFVTFAQNREIVIDKKLSECVVEENIIRIKLSQEDTLKFKHDRSVEIQLRARDTEDNAVASVIKTVNIGRILKEGVI